MNSKIRLQLSVVMFLQYVIWGAWLPLLTRYLTEYMQYRGGANFTGIEAAWVMNAFAMASIVAMFVGGQLADRYFAAERFLAFSHLVGGVTMLLLPMQKSFWPFFTLMLIHCLFYVPTLSLTNSICFANLKDSQKDFGPVRLWGTIGWIAASTPFVFLLKGLKGAEMSVAMSSIFTVAGVASLALSAFCLTLPSTPPAREQGQKFAPFEALKLLAVPSILVLFLVTYVDTLVLWCHFFWTSPFLGQLGIPENWMMPIMSIGQIAEIGTMALLGYALKTLGWRKTMILGILGQIVRFGIYSIGTQNTAWMVIASNVIHGVCYAFFFASVYIFVDEHFPKDARTSAQGLFNLLILGVGPLTANPLWGKLGDTFQVSQGGVPSYNRMFLVPTALAIVATVSLVVFFHPKEQNATAQKV
jgi:nucleoside transporter